MSDQKTGISLSRTALTPTLVGNEENIIYVEFEDGDQRNPHNYPVLKKWAITLTVCYFTGIVSAGASSFAISTSSLMHDLHCTKMEAALGLALYAMGYGIVPLFSSALSEEFGRRPIYIFSSVTFALTQVMVALAPDIGVVLAGRALGGILGATGLALVGGSIADIWSPEKRGLPMTLFAFTSLFSLGLGSVIGGVIQSSLGWRWVQWIHVMFSALFIVLVMLVMNETRSSIILIQIARSQRKLTGNSAYKAKAEIDKECFWDLIKISCTRPLYYLLTEPIVQSFSLWCGFTWGVVYCLVEAATPMFQTIYGFNVQQTGYVYITSSIGATIGFFANLYQDELYRRHFNSRQQEARLYVVCAAALCLPIGMFIVAFTATPKIHWMVSIVGLLVFMTGVMVILQATFLYLADCYDTYASSAQAGQSLSRNLMGMAFPLFAQQLFAHLTYKWALTFFAALALVMVPIPFIFFFYGSKIRARSRASCKILMEVQPTTQPSSVLSSSSNKNGQGLNADMRRGESHVF